VRSLVVVTKHSRPTKPAAQPAELTVSHYLSSLVPQRAERFAQLVRGHWGGCEIRNHWVRDALFEEDATRSKNLNLNGNLAVLRCALIALKSRIASALPWPALFELSTMRPALPYNMVCKNTCK
jgi:predicted transposase YbfD/YdcC